MQLPVIDLTDYATVESLSEVVVIDVLYICATATKLSGIFVADGAAHALQTRHLHGWSGMMAICQREEDGCEFSTCGSKEVVRLL